MKLGLNVLSAGTHHRGMEWKQIPKGEETTFRGRQTSRGSGDLDGKSTPNKSSKKRLIWGGNTLKKNPDGTTIGSHRI